MVVARCIPQRHVQVNYVVAHDLGVDRRESDGAMTRTTYVGPGSGGADGLELIAAAASVMCPYALTCCRESLALARATACPWETHLASWATQSSCCSRGRRTRCRTVALPPHTQ